MRMNGTRVFIGAWLAIAPACALPARAGAERFGGNPPAPGYRWAYSQDGLTFSPTGRSFHAGASAPDLIARPGGDLLAIFEFPSGRRADPPGLAVSRSRDEGDTWTAPRRVRLQRANGVPAGRAALAQDERGGLHLYFLAAGTSGDECRLLTARSRNGLDYLVDPESEISMPEGAPDQLAAFLIDRQAHLLASSPREPGIFLAKSDERRRFAALRPLNLQDVDSIDSVIKLADGYRAYATASGRVRSLWSADGTRWRWEPGIRLDRAADASVASLKSGGYLMLYREPTSAEMERSGKAQQSSPANAGAGDHDSVGLEFAPAGDLAADDETTLDPEGETALAEEEMPDSEWSEGEEETLALLAGEAPLDFSELSADPSLEASESPGAALDGDGESGEWGDELAEEWPDELSDDAGFDSQVGLDGFAPEPDFDSPIDYFAWYRAHALDQPQDNAWEAYAEFIPGPGQESKLPEFTHMFSDPAHAGPPAPWDPAAHPEWEASLQAGHELLEKFRAATRHEGYAHPATIAPDSTQHTDGVPLLLNMLLPHLPAHRQLAKATLADAWRLENGGVQPDKMLDAWETTLRGAEHLGRGATLIEDLVGVAERGLVHQSARWALARNVFSSETQLEEALERLRSFDRGDRDPVRGLRGEQAFAMDITQFLFSPKDEAGRRRRIQTLCDSGMMGEEFAGSDRHERLLRMTPEEARISIEAFNGYYRELGEQMRTGYPQARAADLEATAEKYLRTSPLTEVFLPALSRVHQIRARNEASRRATQLSYEVHLFKARNGRWPASLGELPPESAPVRTDPFTGADFGYRAAGDGFQLYSLSENGRDDGGVHAPRWNDENSGPDGSDDHVFWPPQP